MPVSRTARIVLSLSLPAALGLLALPLAAQAPSYHVVEGWPRDAGKAPDYRTGAVSGVAVDRAGSVFVFQRAPHPVLVFDREGRYQRSWGAGLFTSPHGCRFDPDGNLWLTDNGDHRVMKFSPDGKLLATFGEKGVAAEDPTHFNKPADVAFGPRGDVYVADGYGNSRVVRLSRDGKFVQAWGRKGTGEGEFNLPHTVAVDREGRVYVGDRENNRVQVFTADGRFLREWRHMGAPFGLFLTPDQRLFLADGRAHTVSLFDLMGKRLAQWGGPGSGPGQLDLPHLLCVDERGDVYVTEITGKRLQKFSLR